MLVSTTADKNWLMISSHFPIISLTFHDLFNISLASTFTAKQNYWSNITWVKIWAKAFQLLPASACTARNGTLSTFTLGTSPNIIICEQRFPHVSITVWTAVHVSCSNVLPNASWRKLGLSIAMKHKTLIVFFNNWACESSYNDIHLILTALSVLVYVLDYFNRTCIMHTTTTQWTSSLPHKKFKSVSSSQQ